jgi:hypothetical protein
MANADPPSIPDPDQHTHTQGSPVIMIWAGRGVNQTQSCRFSSKANQLDTSGYNKVYK